MSTPRLVSAAYHHAYGYHGSHSAGWTDWLVHQVVSAIVHSAIYSVVFRLLRRLTLGQAALLVIVTLALLFLWARSRDRWR